MVPGWLRAILRYLVVVIIGSLVWEILQLSLYTIFSEWLNIVIRKSWAYSDLMPVVPVISIGLSPLVQWIIVPGLAMRWIMIQDPRISHAASFRGRATSVFDQKQSALPG